jgi:hypothetical protein
MRLSSNPSASKKKKKKIGRDKENKTAGAGDTATG